MVITVVRNIGNCNLIEHVSCYDYIVIIIQRVASRRDPRLRGKYKALKFFQNIIKFVYETNNTFVTWNTHINLKNIYGH